jgi:CubicO group peptidase (beta-lactamase class C family)
MSQVKSIRRMGWMAAPALALFILLFGTARADDFERARFDAFVQETMATWHVPGIAVATIIDGEVHFVAGYGSRDVAAKLPVTPETLFQIGSITKSFTTAALALLVDDGRLTWDTRVRDVLPDFALADPIASENATVTDVLTHRTGLARHDRLWYLNPMPRDALFARLRHLRSSQSFRDGFQYQNILYVVAGRIAERLFGESWENLVAHNILAPLGLTRTKTTLRGLLIDPDHAAAYALDDDALVPVAHFDTAVIAPAGGLGASARDLIRWAALHLERGTLNEIRLISEENAAALQTPQQILPGVPSWPALGHTSYGYGFELSHYRGERLASHGGGMDGFVAHFSFMPDRNAAIVVLSNLDRNPAPNIIARRFYDRVLGLPPLPWDDRTAERWRKAEARFATEAAADHAARQSGAPPSHPLSDYLGRYEDPGYGTVTIGSGAAGLTLTYGRLTLPLDHVHYDIFEVAEIPLTSVRRLKVTFLYDTAGNIDRVLIPFEKQLDAIVFARRP